MTDESPSDGHVHDFDIVGTCAHVGEPGSVATTGTVLRCTRCGLYAHAVEGITYTHCPTVDLTDWRRWERERST